MPADISDRTRMDMVATLLEGGRRKVDQKAHGFEPAMLRQVQWDLSQPATRSRPRYYLDVDGNIYKGALAPRGRQFIFFARQFKMYSMVKTEDEDRIHSAGFPATYKHFCDLADIGVITFMFYHCRFPGKRHGDRREDHRSFAIPIHRKMKLWQGCVPEPGQRWYMTGKKRETGGIELEWIRREFDDGMFRVPDILPAVLTMAKVLKAIEAGDIEL